MPKPSAVQEAILRTLCYADIFDYPLTAREIFSYLIWQSSETPPSQETLDQFLHRDWASLSRVDGYVVLPGREKLVALRQKRRSWSRKKRRIAERVGKWLRQIPWVKLVALTGTLAMENANANDDIDLMLVTAANRLWATRLVALPLISLVAKRRKPPDRRQMESASQLAGNRRWKDAICLNLLLDETALSLPQRQRNLYTAHEIAQVKVLWSRDNTDQKFRSQNSWTSQYLPNSDDHTQQQSTRKRRNNETRFDWLERLARDLQLRHMSRRITRETISLHSAFFHPRDTASLVLARYQRRLRSLGLTPGKEIDTS